MQIISNPRKSFDVYLTNIPFETVDWMADALDCYLERVFEEIPAEYTQIKDHLKGLVNKK